MVKKGLLALGVLLTHQIIDLSTVLRITLSPVNFKIDALRDLVPIVQFKKLEKLPRTSITSSKVNLLK